MQEELPILKYGKWQANILFNFDDKINFLRQRLVKGRPADEIPRLQHMSHYPFPASGIHMIYKKTKQNSCKKIQLEKFNISLKPYG